MVRLIDLFLFGSASLKIFAKKIFFSLYFTQLLLNFTLSLIFISLGHATTAKTQGGSVSLRSPSDSKEDSEIPLTTDQKQRLEKILSAQDHLPANLLQISDTVAFSKYVLLVDKSLRKLFVYERDGSSISLVAHFDADIGKNDGNKTKRDDHKTPEGIYFLDKKLAPPEIPFSLYGDKAFTTNYPNFFDRLESKTGDGIWLHAVPDTVPLTRGSRGCVVLRNESIHKVSQFIKLRETPILIFDQVDYISKDEHDRRTKHFRDWLEKWRKDWEAEDTTSYLSHYDPRFEAPGGFDYNRWIDHKKRLKKNYKFIQVNLSQPFLLLHRNQLIIKTLQKYTSDQHSDYGVKTLHVVVSKENDYKIVREEWQRAKETGELATSKGQSSDAARATSSLGWDQY